MAPPSRPAPRPKKLLNAAAKAKSKTTVKRNATARAAAKPAGPAATKPADPAATKRAAAKREPAKRALAKRPAPAPDLFSSLHALLHTMRLIERHEEPLCSMHDELKRTGRLSAPQRRRLQQLVDELPAWDFQDDLEALRQAAAA